MNGAQIMYVRCGTGGPRKIIHTSGSDESHVNTHKHSVKGLTLGKYTALVDCKEDTHFSPANQR